jgi:hypothetical protein
MPAGTHTHATVGLDVLGNSHSKAPGRIDLRSPTAKFLRRVKRELSSHVGGNPTPPEFLIIDQCAVLTLQLARIDERIVAGDATTADEDRHAVILQRLCRALSMLGLAGGINHAASLGARMVLKGQRLSNRRTDEHDDEPDEPEATPEPDPEPEVVVVGQPVTRRVGGIEVSRGLTADEEAKKRLDLGNRFFEATYPERPVRAKKKMAAE